MRPRPSEPRAERPRILAYAYDLHPERGSEPGAGWASVRILAGLADVTVITRSSPPDPSGSFAAWQELIPESGTVRFVNVPLPDDPTWAGADHRRRWWFDRPYVSYLAWQYRAGRIAKAMAAEGQYDLAWHLTWANGWLGSSLSSAGLPFILGPIGGGVGPPLRLALALGPRGLAHETVRWIARTANRWLNPLARLTWRRARLILAQNRETLAWLPSGARQRARVFHNATVDAAPERMVVAPGTRPPTALFAARLIAWKGWRLAVQTIAGLPGWRLIVCGDGADQPAMESLVRELGISDRVEFRGWQERDGVLRAMAEEADVLLFPSLHDEAGLAVAEAASIGLPIVCLDVGGPALIAGHAIRAGTERGTVRRLREAVRASLGERPSPLRLDPGTRRTELLGILREAGLFD